MNEKFKKIISIEYNNHCELISDGDNFLNFVKIKKALELIFTNVDFKVEQIDSIYKS